jgi:hypothetical protein
MAWPKRMMLMSQNPLRSLWLRIKFNVPLVY